MKYYVGIDIGGDSARGIILNQELNVITEGAVELNPLNGGEALCKSVAKLIESMLKNGSVNKNSAMLGVGCPGLIDRKNGVVIFSGNLGLKNFPLASTLQALTDMPVNIANDANVAALGEAKFGAGKQYSNSILITLNEGVGGGIIIDGRLFGGIKSAGAEIGHMVIERYGNHCSCGRRGCFEAYSSATALIKKTRQVMEDNCGSEMWNGYTSATVTENTVFEYLQTDYAAKEVFDWYVNYLACGIINLANIFRPQAIMLGGAVSAHGDTLCPALQTLVDKELFGGTDFAPVKVVTASLGNRAGVFGAAALNM